MFKTVKAVAKPLKESPRFIAGLKGTLESKKQTLLERLLHNPHTYGHQSDASNVGSALGLSGTHTMPDGSVMPGATHQQYLNSLRRNNQITTSSGTSIPTRNLRRNSGY